MNTYDAAGILRGGTFADTLPDEMMPCADHPYTRSGQKVCVGLSTHICKACGKRFEATGQHRYRVERKHRVEMYCSYKCFRPVEKEQEDRFRALCFGFVAVRGGDKSPLEKARNRVEKCRKKLARYEGILKDPDKWAAMTSDQRRCKAEQVRYWLLKLEESEEALEVLKNHENA